MSSNSHPGMGAMVHALGTSFRVWAPHADGVGLKGTFNDWNDQSHPLQREEGGCWATDVPGVQAGAQYKFRLALGKDQFDRIDPRAQEVTNSVGAGVVVDHGTFDWQGVEFTAPPLNALVIYEMHIGSFNAPQYGQPGNFAQAMERLEHLKKLGIAAVQLVPVAEFAGDYSWGYNPAHIFAVESGYGGPDALKLFVREAHRQAIAVILDVVYNHFGPSDLDLWRFDGWSENDKGGIYFYNDHRAETPWGATRPDYGRNEVREFIRDNALMWLREYRVDGLRMDMTLFMRSIGGGVGDELPDGWSLMQWLNSEIRAQHPAAITISEDLRDNAAITDAADNGGAGFHAQWDASFVHPVRTALRGRRARCGGAQLQRRRLSARYLQRVAQRGSQRQSPRAARN